MTEIPTATVGGAGLRDRKRRLFVFVGSDATEHELPEGGTLVIGRDASANVVIDHPTLSRSHARLTLGDHVTIEDTGSRNGTVVNGRRLGPKEVVLVSPGSTIELGDALLVLRAGSGSADVLGTSEGGTAGEDALERKLTRVAKTDVAVVVAGEAGAGKRFVAERIHALSPQKTGPFVELRCHHALAASEIAAAVTAARSGTLLLREPGELAREQQLALLSALASTKPLRIVTAATTDLATRGPVIPELLQRLATLTIVVPPLRARIRELPGIVETLTQSVAAEQSQPVPLVTADAVTFLGRHTWPGNVRELRNAITRAMLSGKTRVLTASHFSFEMAPVAGATGGTLSSAVNDAEHRRILEVLRECRGNQSRAAKVLGISRGTLISRLERYSIPRPRK